jgi:hypothetical protein
MNELIKKLCHIIPGIHFYSKWSMAKVASYGSWERQERYCSICNKKQYRIVEKL